MSQFLPSQPIDQLSVPERLDLITQLWDSIPDSPEALPIPEWHKEELARRIKIADKSPNDVLSWEEVKAKLRERK